MTRAPCRVDVEANRLAIKWSRRELAGRALWEILYPLFRLSPRPLWGWRRAMLRAFGAKVGSDVHVYPSVRISVPWNLTLGDHCAIGDHAILYSLGTITVGARATISQGAHLCAGTHDIESTTRPLLKLPIVVGDDAWIAAEAFVGPDVTVGAGAIVGARAVVMKDIEARLVVVGNPAKPIKRRTL